MHIYTYTHIYTHTYITYIHIHIPRAMKRQWGEVSKIIFTYFKNIPSSTGKTTDAEAEQWQVEARGNMKAELLFNWLSHSFPSNSFPTPSLPLFPAFMRLNPLNPQGAAHMRMAGPSTGVWVAAQGPHTWRKLILHDSAAISCWLSFSRTSFIRVGFRLARPCVCIQSRHAFMWA